MLKNTKHKGQVSTEFVILLAIVLIISLIAFLSFSDISVFTSLKQTQYDNKAWRNAQIPIGGSKYNSTHITLYVGKTI